MLLSSVILVFLHFEWLDWCNHGWIVGNFHSLKANERPSWSLICWSRSRRNLKVVIVKTHLSLRKVYLCGIILQNLSCTCWTHTNITGSRLARALHFLLLSCHYSCHRLSRALSPCYSSSQKWKQRGYVSSKQVNHVKFLKLLREIRPRELQLFWSPSKRWLFIF